MSYVGSYLQLGGGIEEVGGRPALEGAEGDVAARQRGDIRVLGRAEGARLLAALGVLPLRQAVGIAASRTAGNQRYAVISWRNEIRPTKVYVSVAVTGDTPLLSLRK